MRIEEAFIAFSLNPTDDNTFSAVMSALNELQYKDDLLYIGYVEIIQHITDHYNMYSDVWLRDIVPLLTYVWLDYSEGYPGLWSIFEEYAKEHIQCYIDNLPEEEQVTLALRGFKL